MEESKKYKIVIISDVHGKWGRVTVPPCDLLISCGDFSFKGEPHMIKDFHKWLNKQPAKHIISGLANHECLDKDTELLTKRGWIKYTDIQKEDKVLSINSNNKSTWTNIDNIIVKKSKYIYEYKKGNIDLAITENHRIPYYFYYSYKKELSDLKYATYKNLPYQIKLISSIKNGNYEYDIKDDEIRLLSWVLTDGSCTKSSGAFYIYQSKVEGIEKIKTILENLGCQYKLNYRHREIKEICGKAIKTQLPQGVFTLHKEHTSILSRFIGRGKVINKEPFNKFSSRQIKILLTSMMDGDGSWCKTRYTAGALNGKKEFLDWVQTLAVQAGIRSSLVNYRDNDWRLNLAFSVNTVIAINLKEKLVKKEYNDIVWCIQTKYTNFMVRRGGKAYFTGNCWVEQNFEEAKALAVEQCPRVNFIDEGLLEIEGLKIWYSAITPFFHNWAYNRFRGPDIRKHWSKIPENTDILITHGPPYGILDVVSDGSRQGCQDLLDRVKELKNLKGHFFGHLHENSGILEQDGITFVNAAICNDAYKPVFNAKVLELTINKDKTYKVDIIQK